MFICNLQIRVSGMTLKDSQSGDNHFDLSAGVSEGTYE